ncbi:hypothetical protein EVAR_6807_1 [Eumeta japonica]|uniref:Uncharacterized protein n=1 Tax=Eumeta variegata TaxID=151549 RepID=A0A4C1U656_EUMVA|nr:hypothetical protein EVAR_6807_1 [Eumeta japonica]
MYEVQDGRMSRGSTAAIHIRELVKPLDERPITRYHVFVERCYFNKANPNEEIYETVTHVGLLCRIAGLRHKAQRRRVRTATINSIRPSECIPLFPVNCVSGADGCARRVFYWNLFESIPISNTTIH